MRDFLLGNAATHGRRVERVILGNETACLMTRDLHAQVGVIAVTHARADRRASDRRPPACSQCTLRRLDTRRSRVHRDGN
ncbi:hypothetical protein SB719_20040, partial [Pantoea sp. SIMBA_079]|uniref:hypothetical protein n=1 Tax=Pantoea sp. SIMBA_079 TaxID=3085817 RepID=UPI0039955FB6